MQNSFSGFRGANNWRTGVEPNTQASPMTLTNILLFLATAKTITASSINTNYVNNNNNNNDDLRWVRGINYVPSTSHNDVATWQDYNRSLVEQELQYAALIGFNSIRVFLSSLPWLYNRSAFIDNLHHFINTLESYNLTSQLVVFDSCFGNVNANITWIESGEYKNYTWIPNPGPDIVASGEEAWATYDGYIEDILSTVGTSNAVLLYDLHNEPNFAVNLMVDFITYTANKFKELDKQGRLVTVGIAGSNQQSLVQNIVTALSFHNYNGGENGLALSNDIASQRALATSLNKPLLLTETMSRPNDLLVSVLPAVFGCFNSSGTSTLESSVGWFIWELMLGVDQFNNDWQAPYQGLIYPSWGPQGGKFRYLDEQTLLSQYIVSPIGSPPCPSANSSFIPDTSSQWSWSPEELWTAWVGNGPPLGTLHYANEGGAVATLSPFPVTSGRIRAVSIIYKRGPDCGYFSLSINGVMNITSFDSYDQNVNWAAELNIPLPQPVNDFVIDITVLGRSNSSSSNTYVQIVGARPIPE